jgi:tyrosine-protein phosphatase YwqE
MARGIEAADFTGLELDKTGYILLEFPREPFGSWMFDLIETLLFERKMKVIIAHVNRVTAAYKKDVCKNLFDYNDLVFQVNTEAFRGIMAKDPFKGYELAGLKFDLGTDTHDLSHRAPDFDKALKRLNTYPVAYLRESMEYMTAKINRKIEKNKSAEV